MKDVSRLCFSCMEDNGGSSVCPHCGFNSSEYKAPMHHLSPGSILNGKYWTGKVIGEGGFGITYIGWDMNLEIKVAIKEYFPSGYVSRDVTNTDTITVFTNADPSFFVTGRDKFINEAKTLAKFDNVPGIVSVKDFFMENGTAYIVMEYVEGKTFKEYLAENGGKIPAQTVFSMMKPLMSSLSQVHKKGLIHRDISPDNIKITNDGQVKLLDFGAARDISADGQKSLSIQLKPGYAPEEQYRSHGKQGAWTDVYALCATMYRAMTGSTPLEALERVQNDELVPPSRMGGQISPVQENALMRGMAVFANQRIQNIDELYNAIYNNVQADPGPVYVQNNRQASGPVQGQNSEPPKEKSKTLIAVACVLGAVLVIAAVVFGIVVHNMLDSEDSGTGLDVIREEIKETPAPVATEIPVPVFTLAQASSIRGTDSQGGTYSVESVLSQDNMTKWVPSKSSGNGVGQWIQVSAATPQYIQGIKVLNGYHKNAETWAKNNRVSACTITFSNGESRSFTLSDTMDMITLDLGGIVETSSIRLTINGIYKGTSWNDTAITYLGAY